MKYTKRPTGHFENICAVLAKLHFPATPKTVWLLGSLATPI
jgi:hypothetical protein